MQQGEVIQEALRMAPASAAPHAPTAEPGEKVIRAEDAGDVDHVVITEWVEANGGRAESPEGDLHWVVAEAELAL